MWDFQIVNLRKLINYKFLIKNESEYILICIVNAKEDWFNLLELINYPTEAFILLKIIYASLIQKRCK